MNPKHVIRLLITLFCIASVLLFVIFLCGFRSNHDDSPGWRLLKTQDSYSLNSRQMNGNDSHTLKLTAGDVLEVTFEAEKGNLHMKITAPDGTSVYDGNGKDPTAFEINIRETGLYTVAVEARHAKGKIFIRLKEVTK